MHIAPRKVRLAAGLIRGMTVPDAERELMHRIKRASGPLFKLLRSAVANARHNFLVSDAVMTIKDIRVNPGPVSKRFRPRAFGRAAPIRRRTSHVSLVLEAAVHESAERREKGSPVVREATRQDMREASSGPSRERDGGPAAPESKSKARQPKAVRRIFQRKAI